VARISLLGAVVQHDRIVVIGGLLLVVGLSWAYLLSGAGTMQEMGGMLMPMSPEVWTPGYALLMLVMWSVMMAAMMLPSAAPMILFYAMADRNRRTQSGQNSGTRAGIFVAAYLVCWTAFSSLAVVVQYCLEKAALLSRMMETTSLILAAVIFIAVGIYQLSPLKQTCLKNCRSPLDFITSRWRDGKRGAFVMGLQHGMYCVGCCWMLMLLLFVGGVMNLAWITGLAFFAIVEKTIPLGHWIGKLAGLLLIVWGAGILFGIH
jgi:predicted metal-binding membrane protein